MLNIEIFNIAINFHFCNYFKFHKIKYRLSRSKKVLFSQMFVGTSAFTNDKTNISFFLAYHFSLTWSNSFR